MTMAFRAMKLTGLTVDVAAEALAQFGDVSDISSGAQESVKACVSAWLAVGRDGNVVARQAQNTRAEAAVIV